MERTASPWQRAIILVDMNAFFASIEQRDNPEWQGLPVAVTNGEQGTCIITCSYEARAYGIKTGMRLHEALKCCPQLLRVPSRPRRYTQVSKQIMEGLLAITPDIEVFSVDEAFLDVSRCQSLHGHPVKIAHMVKDRVWQVAGLPCSVGLSGDKTTAKFAAKLQKPNGLTVIPPWEAKQRLKNVPVTELCGIAKGIGNFLASYGVLTCGDMERLPIGVLAKRFGPLGRRIWHMCQGADPSPVNTEKSPAKSMGHGKVMPPNTRDKQTILTYYMHMCEKLAARLRRHQLRTQRLYIGLRLQQGYWLDSSIPIPYPCDDGKVFFQLCQHFIDEYWDQQGAKQVQVTAMGPLSQERQLDLFTANDESRDKVNQVVDDINQRYKNWVIHPARLLQRSKMHDVIAFGSNAIPFAEEEDDNTKPNCS